MENTVTDFVVLLRDKSSVPQSTTEKKETFSEQKSISSVLMQERK